MFYQIGHPAKVIQGHAGRTGVGIGQDKGTAAALIQGGFDGFAQGIPGQVQKLCRFESTDDV